MEAVNFYKTNSLTPNTYSNSNSKLQQLEEQVNIIIEDIKKIGHCLGNASLKHGTDHPYLSALF